MLRLRQIALVAHDRDAVVDGLHTVLGLDVAFNDPAVATFGLHNAVLPAGHQFIEVVAPIREGTAGGRYLARRHGDGGYMAIFQCDDHTALEERLAALEVRVAFRHDTEHYRIRQLHPRDTGGTFLEIDVQVGGEALDGPWEPAGPSWQAARTARVAAIVAAELQSEDPEPLATRWGAILDRDVTPLPDHPAGEAFAVSVDNATLRFVRATDGRGEGLGGIDVRIDDVAAALTRAAAAGLRVTGDVVALGGVRVRLLD